MDTKIGFTGLLTLMFVAAKLFGAISWSWIWVFSPLWIGFAIVAAFFVIAFIIALLTDK